MVVAMTAQLEIVAGGAAAPGRIILVPDAAAMTIGRALDVELSCPSDVSMSRRHAELQAVGSNVRVRDLGSKHGVFVNGARVAEALLAHGDQLQIGDLVLRVRFDASVTVTHGRTVLGWASANDQGARVARTPGTLWLPEGYEHVRMLGEGAMGSVHLARHVATGAERAIKQILPLAVMSDQARALFLREARVQARLVHPNVVRVFSVEEAADGAFSIVMEAAGGGSVGNLLRARTFLPAAEAVPLTIQALDGLQHAHDLGIVHRDIKEDNILLDIYGVAKLADFGLAKNYQESGASGITREGSVAGTLPYMSREQLLDFKHVKPPADVYSMGATLYRLLTGHYPRDYVDGENWILVALEKPVVPIHERIPYLGLSDALCAIVHRALATDVADRYPTAREFRDALAALPSH